MDCRAVDELVKSFNPDNLENEPESVPALPGVPDLNERIRYVFGSKGW